MKVIFLILFFVSTSASAIEPIIKHTVHEKFINGMTRDFCNFIFKNKECVVYSCTVERGDYGKIIAPGHTGTISSFCNAAWECKQVVSGSLLDAYKNDIARAKSCEKSEKPKKKGEPKLPSNVSDSRYMWHYNACYPRPVDPRAIGNNITYYFETGMTDYIQGPVYFEIQGPSSAQGNPKVFICTPQGWKYCDEQDHSAPAICRRKLLGISPEEWNRMPSLPGW